MDRTYRLDSPPIMQGLSVPFACVGSGDPVRVLHLYTMNTLDVLLKHLLLRHMYNLLLPILLCYAQALRSETSYCYRDRVTLSTCVQVTLCECRVRIPRTVLCGALYTACVDASRTVFWDRSILSMTSWISINKRNLYLWEEDTYKIYFLYNYRLYVIGSLTFSFSIPLWSNIEFTLFNWIHD